MIEPEEDLEIRVTVTEDVSIKQLVSDLSLDYDEALALVYEIDRFMAEVSFTRQLHRLTRDLWNGVLEEWPDEKLEEEDD